MNIPNEHLELMERCVRKHAHKFTFSYYELEDIVQEGMILCLKIYEKWDGVRDLEPFMSVSVYRRLCTFLRDNYCKVGTSTEEIRRRLHRLEHLEYEAPFIDETDHISEFDHSDLMQELDKMIPPQFRKDYLMMMDGVKINKRKRLRIQEYIEKACEKLEIKNVKSRPAE